MTVEQSVLLVEMAAREAARRRHIQDWKKVTARELAAVLRDLGFKIVAAP